MNDMYDQKKLVTKKEYTLRDVACYRYPCGRCQEVEFLPQVIAKTFNKLAPKDWFCVAVNDEKSYYCPKCAREIGIGC